MAAKWFDEWFDTIKGAFGGYEDDVKQSLARLGYTTELSLSQLQLEDLDSTALPVGQKRAILYVTGPFRAKFAGRSVAER
jgi:hypothetical protein